MQPRPWDRPPAANLPEPDPFLHLRLRVGDAWLTAAGEWDQVVGASTVSLWSILGYLRWYAPLLMARDPDARGLEDPDAYLGSRQLVAAIDAELAGRGEIVAGTALMTLRTLGGAPWELPIGPRRRPTRSRR